LRVTKGDVAAEAFRSVSRNYRIELPHLSRMLTLCSRAAMAGMSKRLYFA
jgi:hypothetical protein